MMKLPKLPVNKTILIATVALSVGLVIGGVDISHMKSNHNSTTADPAVTATAPSQPDSTTTPAVPDTIVNTGSAEAVSPLQATNGNPTGASVPTISSEVPQSQSSPTIAVAPDVPVVVTDTSQYTQPNPTKDGIVDIYCHYTYNDGTSQDKYAGSSPVDTQSGRVQYGVSCP